MGPAKIGVACFGAALGALGAPSAAFAQVAPQPAGQPSYSVANPNPYGTPMESNGVKAPDPIAGKAAPANAVSNDTNSAFDGELDASKDSDAGRRLTWFWLEAVQGFETAGLHTFNKSEKDLTGGVFDTSGNGGAVGGGLGARLYIFTIGLRGRYGFFPAWQFGRIGGEFGVHFPLGYVEPHIEFGGGYAALAHLGAIGDKIGVTGGYARAAFGVDFFPVGRFALGVVSSFDFTALTRPAVSATDLAALESSNTITTTQATSLANKGTGFGADFAIQGTIGLHL